MIFLINFQFGLKLDIVVDDSSLITDIVDGLKTHLLEGTLLATIVVLFFPHESTFNFDHCYPQSLSRFFGAIAAIYFAGYTFNIMTMLGGYYCL